MAYLSVPSPGKWILEFWGNYVSTMFRRFVDQHFSKKWISEGSSEGVTQIRKGSCIDPLAMRFSLKSEFLIGNVHHFFQFFSKTLFMLFQYRQSVLKKTQIFGPKFEPCSSGVAVDYCFPKKNDFWKTNTPKRAMIS